MPETKQEKIVIPLSIFPRELLEKACLEVKKNKAKMEMAGTKRIKRA